MPEKDLHEKLIYHYIPIARPVISEDGPEKGSSGVCNDMHITINLMSLEIHYFKPIVHPVITICYII